MICATIGKNGLQTERSITVLFLAHWSFLWFGADSLSGQPRQSAARSNNGGLRCRAAPMGVPHVMCYLSLVLVIGQRKMPGVPSPGSLEAGPKTCTEFCELKMYG